MSVTPFYTISPFLISSTVTLSSERTWVELSRVTVKGAEYDSRERQPHPKCLEGTRVCLLNHINELLDKREKNQLIWLHGTAGVGKSAVAFTVAERMRGLKVSEHTNVETRLAGTFFFSRKHTERSTTGYFFATLVYQLASNFPSIREDVKKSIYDNPALLDPNKSLRNQMEVLFLQPLRRLYLRLRDCQPLTFVVDALDECTSEPELIDLILSLARALREPDFPVTHILLTSRSESHICRAMQNEEVRSLVCEIPVTISGEGITTIISLDGADVDNDICIFLRHSFRELGSRYPDFPQPSRDQFERLASRAGRRFIVASTMMKFIDEGDNDPNDRLQLMLELTSKLLRGTEVYKLYDCILSTCADPRRAYLYLSIVASLTNPLPLSQISTLLGPGLGKDVEKTLKQLRSVMNIPPDSTLPVNIYHSSIRDYVSDSSNCGLSQVQDMPSPHCLLARSSFRLMVKKIPESTALLDALLKLKTQSQAMQPHDPQKLKDSLAFLVQPLKPLSVLISLLWIRGNRGSDLRSWLESLDGCAWLQTEGGKDWLQTREGEDWLRTQGGKDWLQTHGGQHWLQAWGGDWFQTQEGDAWLQTQGGEDWLRTRGGQDWLHTQGGQDWLQTPCGYDWLQTQGVQDWLRTLHGRDWLHTQGGKDWLQTQGGRGWLHTDDGRDWLQTQDGKHWLQTQGGQDLLQTQGLQYWLRTQRGQDWLQTSRGQQWLLIPNGQDWLQTQDGCNWLQTPRGRDWLQTPRGHDWLRTQGVREWLHTWTGQEWLHTHGGGEWLHTRGGREWLRTRRMQKWLQTPDGQEWLQMQGGEVWLQTQGGEDWLRALGGEDWLQSSGGRAWLRTQGGQDWLLRPGGRAWLRTQGGQDWLPTPRGYHWLQAQGGQDWLKTSHGRDWLQTQGGQK